MNIDTEHLHNWMCAIRESENPMRTLDAFWRGQMQSKEWLIQELKKFDRTRSLKIDIFGGWVGTLASMLFQSGMNISRIQSIDIDPSCEKIADRMNQIELEAGKFKAYTADMCTFKSNADIVINTSFEHLTQEQYDQWLENMPKYSLYVMQSNNYDIPEHVRIAKDLGEFMTQSKLGYIEYGADLDLPKYKRFMLIGRK